MEPIVRDRLTLAAVLGAGVIVGVSGLYMYYKLHNCVGRELTHLTRTIESLRKDIEELKTTSSSRVGLPPSGIRRTCSGDRADGSAAAAAAVVSSGEDNDEYYDVPDEGDGSQTWAIANGEIAVLSEDLTAFFEEIDKLVVEGGSAEMQESYDKLMLKKDDNVSNVKLMWRLARSCAGLTTFESDTEQLKKIIFDGVKYATIALALDENSAEAHKWYAILLGKTTDYVSVQDKIKNGLELKQHLDIAITLKPEDHILYFTLGRWFYGVAMLTWIERKVASTVFGVLLTGTFAEALDQFMEVERRKPGQWKENTYYIAKCLIAEKKYSEVMDWLDKAAQTPSRNKDEEEIHKDIVALQGKYQGYRKN